MDSFKYTFFLFLIGLTPSLQTYFQKILYFDQSLAFENILLYENYTKALVASRFEDLYHSPLKVKLHSAICTLAPQLGANKVSFVGLKNNNYIFYATYPIQNINNEYQTELFLEELVNFIKKNNSDDTTEPIYQFKYYIGLDKNGYLYRRPYSDQETSKQALTYNYTFFLNCIKGCWQNLKNNALQKRF